MRVLLCKTHRRSGAEITAARFAGEVMGDTFTRQITGALPDRLDAPKHS
jgi:hypothetical protein